jgi:hypothetical protein
MSAVEPSLPGGEFGPVIERMRELAALPGDPEGNEVPSSDDELLILCAEVLELHRKEQRHRAEHEGIFQRPRGLIFCPPSEAELLQNRQMLDKWQATGRQVAVLSKRAAKIKAVTGAGVYAKAMIIAASRTGATVLAMSLARDLMASPRIRAAIWPA